MVRPSRFIKVMLFFSLLSYSAWANESLIPLKFSGHYDFALAGIPFGGMRLSFTQTPSRYQATADVETTGVARIFVPHTSHTTSRGTGQHFTYDNVTYESRYQTKKKPKSAKFTKKNGVIVQDVVTPPDNRANRPAVPLADKSAAFDPLAFGLALRSHFADALKQGKKAFSLDYYDGRRLTRVDLTVGDEKNLRIGDKKIPVYTLFARRTLLAGFTRSELARHDANEASLQIYFSHDAQFLPILLEFPLYFGIVTATLRM